MIDWRVRLHLVIWMFMGKWKVLQGVLLDKEVLIHVEFVVQCGWNREPVKWGNNQCYVSNVLAELWMTWEGYNTQFQMRWTSKCLECLKLEHVRKKAVVLRLSPVVPQRKGNEYKRYSGVCECVLRNDVNIHLQPEVHKGALCEISVIETLKN